jgi:DNA-binding winged helix-turn-helix (wHTH) protein
MRAHNTSLDTSHRTDTAFVGADSAISEPRSGSIHLLTSSPGSRDHHSVVRSTRLPPRLQYETAEVLADIDGLSVLVRFHVQDIPAEMRSEFVSRGVDVHSLLSSTLEKMVDRMRGSCQRTNAPPKTPLATVALMSSGEPLAQPPAPLNETVLRVGPIELDLLDRTAKRGDRRIDLRPREFQLLKYMMQRSDELLTRATLLRDVWHYKFVPKTNLVDVHLGRLRRKVDGSNEAPLIRNVRGEGFVLSATPFLQGSPPRAANVGDCDANEFFRNIGAVGVCCIDEVNFQFGQPLQRSQRFGPIGRLAPDARACERRCWPRS